VDPVIQYDVLNYLTSYAGWFKKTHTQNNNL
jgi:hypothetical protein